MNEISTIDIFQLLGLEKLSPEERKSYILRISRISIQQAIEKAIKDEILNLEEVEQLSQEIQDPIEIQNKLLTMCPSLTTYIENSVNNMKIEILQKQVDETIQKAQMQNDIDMSSAIDLRSYLNTPIDQTQQSILLEKVRSFRELQNKILPAN